MRNLLAKNITVCVLCLLLFWRFCITIMIKHISCSNCQRAGGGRGVTEFDGQIMEMLSMMTPSFLPPFYTQPQPYTLFVIYEHRKKMLTCRDLNEVEQPSQCSCCAWYCLSVRGWCQWHVYHGASMFPRYTSAHNSDSSDICKYTKCF